MVTSTQRPMDVLLEVDLSRSSLTRVPLNGVTERTLSEAGLPPLTSLPNLAQTPPKSSKPEDSFSMAMRAVNRYRLPSAEEETAILRTAKLYEARLVEAVMSQPLVWRALLEDVRLCPSSSSALAIELRSALRAANRRFARLRLGSLGSIHCQAQYNLWGKRIVAQLNKLTQPNSSHRRKKNSAPTLDELLQTHLALVSTQVRNIENLALSIFPKAISLKRALQRIETTASADSRKANALGELRRYEKICAMPWRQFFAGFIRMRALEDAMRRCREQFLISNFRLAGKGAKGMAARVRTPILDAEDIAQESFLALNRAVEKFDPERGYRFSTYAINAIQRRRGRNGVASGPISLPLNVLKQMSSLSKARFLLTGQLGREPNLSELARRTKIPIKRILDLAAMERIGMPASMTNSPINTPGADREVSLDTVAVDHRMPKTAEAPFHQEFINWRSQVVRSALKALTDKEQTVVRLRFGLDRPALTLKEVGEIVGVTRERIRQIETAAIEKLAAALEDQRAALLDEEDPNPACHTAAALPGSLCAK